MNWNWEYIYIRVFNKDLIASTYFIYSTFIAIFKQVTLKMQKQNGND